MIIKWIQQNDCKMAVTLYLLPAPSLLQYDSDACLITRSLFPIFWTWGGSEMSPWQVNEVEMTAQFWA